MNRHEPEVHEPRAAEGPEMVTLMRQGVVEALREHKNAGRSVIAWDRETRQVIEIPATEIVIPEDEVGADSI